MARASAHAQGQGAERELTTYIGTHAAGTIRVTLRQQPCQDSMSGDGFPTTVEVRVNGERRQGCGTGLERQR